MSMLFVHFQNPQFEKWTLSRVSGIFFCKKLRKININTPLSDNVVNLRKNIINLKFA